LVGSATSEVAMKRVKTGQDVLEYELLEEQAATIGRLARELRNSLDALAATDSRDPQREHLVDAAGYALWNFVVQRDCSGFGGTTEHVLKHYAVPAEVRARMGVLRTR
jgi:hypothetical protein